MAPSLDANAIYLGGEPRGYIQGNQHPRVDNLTSLTNTLIKSAYRTITRQKDEYQTDLVYRTGTNTSDIQAPPHPAVIRHSWNNTDRLVELALALDPHYQPDPGIYPPRTPHPRRGPAPTRTHAGNRRLRRPRQMHDARVRGHPDSRRPRGRRP